MKLRFLCVPIVSVAMASTALCAQTAPGTTLLALSKQDHTLSIVDPQSLAILARVPVGDDPHEVVASADGRTAYVSNYGFGEFHTLTAVDLEGRRPAGVIDLGALRGPHGLFFGHGKVWFTAEAAKAIGSYDPATGRIDWIMGTGQNRTHMIYVSPDAKRILTTNVNSATVTIFDKVEGRAGAPMPLPPAAGGLPPGATPIPPGGDWQLTVVPVGGGSEGFDVSPDSREAWVANAWDGTISILDLVAKKVTATLAADVKGANRLKFTPDGKLVLVTPGTALVVLDATTRKVVKRLADVHGSGGIQMQPDGARAYVACGRDNAVAVIDLKKLEMLGHIDIASPDGLAWAVKSSF